MEFSEDVHATSLHLYRIHIIYCSVKNNIFISCFSQVTRCTRSHPSIIDDPSQKPVLSPFSMSQPHPSRIRHSAAERLPCQWCGDEYNIRGLKRHEAACKRTQETTKTDQEYENELRQRRTQSNVFRYVFFLFVVLISPVSRL